MNIVALILLFPSFTTYTEGSHKSQDALSEVMILVKEEAKIHDLKLLIAVSKCALAKKGVFIQSILSILIRQGLFTALRRNCHFLDPEFLNYQFHPNPDSYISKLTWLA